MVAKSIDLVVQLRLDRKTGHRRVQSIFEVTGLEGNVISGNDLWLLDPATGKLTWTGIRPRCLARFAAEGIAYDLPSELPA